MLTFVDFAFYKVLLIAVDALESNIIDERHFSRRSSAEAFANENASGDIISVIVQVN